MNKKNLNELMSKRNPLLPKREVVVPTNLYTSIQVDKTTSTQNDKYTTLQVENPTSREVVKSTNPQEHKPTKPLVEKYTTHLTPETVKKIKRAAFENDRKDYEVVQKALDKYFENEAK